MVLDHERVGVHWQRITAIVVVGALLLVLGAQLSYLTIPMQAQANCIPSRHVVSGEGGGGGSNTGNPPVCPDDLGDAPASYGVLRAAMGAFHFQDPLKPIRLGLTVDTEPDGQPTNLAWGDLDPDEDGLISASLHQGTPGSHVVVRSTGSGKLNVFVDFNQDGFWAGSEEVANNVSITSGVPLVLPVTVPASAVLGTTYMRMRISENGFLSAFGGAPNGEVEDHAVRICPPRSACCRRVAFVVDSSRSMNTNSANQHAEDVVLSLLSGLDFPPGEGAIITFNTTGTLRAPMQSNKANLVAVAATISEGPIENGTYFAPGIDLGQTQLGVENPLCESVMFLITDGGSSDPVAATAAANAAKNNGTRIIVIGIDVSVTMEPVLQALASSPNDFFNIFAGEDVDTAASEILLEIDCSLSECPGPGVPSEDLSDLGDAPDSTNHFQQSMTAYSDTIPHVVGAFPSVGDGLLSPPIGPRHLQPSADSYLGASVTKEHDADFAPDDDRIPNLRVVVDDSDNDGADDGLGFPIALEPCGSASLAYTVTITGGTQPRYVNAWFDYNRDGDWADTIVCSDPERGTIQVQEWSLQNHLLVLGSGIHELVSPAFNVAGAVSVSPTSMWIRISIAEDLAPLPADGRGPTGGYQYGETEDYLIERNASGLYEPYPEN